MLGVSMLTRSDLHRQQTDSVREERDAVRVNRWEKANIMRVNEEKGALCARVIMSSQGPLLHCPAAQLN